MGLLNEAIAYACAAHGDTRRKGDGAPAVLHALEAATVAAGLTDDEEVLAAAVLHDTVEDTGARLEDIEARFGPRVAALVEAESEDKMRHLPPEQSWLARKEAAVAKLRAAADPGVAVVALGDKLSNLRSLYRGWQERGEALWLAFNEKDPARHHWYYRAVADALAPLSDTAAWREYDWLIGRVFGESETDNTAAAPRKAQKAASEEEPE